jgi:hypothetical protein
VVSVTNPYGRILGFLDRILIHNIVYILPKKNCLSNRSLIQETSLLLITITVDLVRE